MNALQLVYVLAVFLAVAVLAFAVMLALVPRPTRDRLKELSEVDPGRKAARDRKLVKLVRPFAKLALPTEGWEHSAVRQRFMHAGYRGNSAPVFYFSAKAILALAFPAAFLVYLGAVESSLNANTTLFRLLILSAMGYYLPNVVLARRVAHRQREIFESFPDALDLMRVCVEAGLALDAAIARVSDEFRLSSPILAEEFYLVNLELRAGSTRERALRNLAMRTNLEEVEGLVAMLVQADRFGTSVADSLRVHSDMLRSKRSLRAEEAAAKIPVKLLFPLIFCIFPSLLLVLLGPAFIGIYRVLLPAMTGG